MTSMSIYPPQTYLLARTSSNVKIELFEFFILLSHMFLLFFFLFARLLQCRVSIASVVS